MEHLVENHLYGNYYISDDEPENIERYCEQCGDHDNIIFSWVEGNRLEAFLNYFSSIKEDEEQIKTELELDLTVDDIIANIYYEYQNDIDLINCLVEDEYFTKEEQIKLLKQVKKTEKKQFDIIKQAAGIKVLKKVPR